MKALFAAIDRTIELLVAAIFAGMVAVGSWQVFSRFVLNFTPSWSEEIQIFGHIWLVFLAIPIAYRRGAHITVEAIRRVMAPWMNKALDLLIELLWVGFAVATAYYSYRVSLVTGNSVSPGLEIPMSYPYYGMILGSVYLLFVVIRRLAGELPPPDPDQLAARGDDAMITFLLTSLLGVMLHRHPDPDLHRADRLRRHGDAARRRHAAVRAEDVRPARFLHAAGDALFHSRRLDHDRRWHQQAAGRFRARAGRAFSRRARACLGRRQHDDVRRIGLVHGRRVGDRLDPDPAHEADRLQARLRRGADRDRRDDGGDHSAEHDHGDLRRHRPGLDRRAVPRRHHSGHPDRSRADDHHQALHLSSRLSRAAPGHGRASTCARCGTR